MILIPDDIRARLLANRATERETDHIPVVKLFNPCGAATWIITEMMADGDTLFGLADLGFGCPELGHVSLAEIESVRGPLGLSCIYRGFDPRNHSPVGGREVIVPADDCANPHPGLIVKPDQVF